MDPRYVLRIEGLAISAAATAAYSLLDGPLWLYLLLFFAPELGMLGYIANTRIGSWTYNTVHTYVLPLALGGIGIWQTIPSVVLFATIWTAHIGFDRALGYGLKYPTAFGDTDLSAKAIAATNAGAASMETDPLTPTRRQL